MPVCKLGDNWNDDSQKFFNYMKKADISIQRGLQFMLD